MVKEIIETLYKTEKKLPVLISYVDSKYQKLTKPGFHITDFDYYKVVERLEDKGIVICWDEGDTLEYVEVYIARFDD